MKKRTKKTGNQRVLELLRKRKKGITFSDFGVGFRLSAYIYNLRYDYNMEIIKVNENMGNGASKAKYILVKE